MNPYALLEQVPPAVLVCLVITFFSFVAWSVFSLYCVALWQSGAKTTDKRYPFTDSKHPMSVYHYLNVTVSIFIPALVSWGVLIVALAVLAVVSWFFPLSTS